VVFALAVGAVFAVDLSADVDAFANVFEGASKGGGGVKASGGFDAIRLQGAGDLADGKFGGKVRLDFAGGAKGQGYGWWKPIDQFKLILGQSNASDGFWGKEGNSGWNFNQKAYGTKVASGSGNIWGGGYLGGIYTTDDDPDDPDAEWYKIPGTDLLYRDAFAKAADSDKLGLYMEIRPMEMLGINIGWTNFTGKWDKSLFTSSFVFQVDLNFAFGNIALTYLEDNIFLYYGGSFGAINLDVGLSMHDLTAASDLNSIYFGAALKYSGGAFNVKFRTSVGIPVKSYATFRVLFDVLPYFAINDNMSVFVNAGMGMNIKSGLQQLGWQFNPYIRIGAEWGPSFYAGIQVLQNEKGGAITFALPIGITVGF